MRLVVPSTLLSVAIMDPLWGCIIVLQVILHERDNEMSRKLIRLLKKFRESDPSHFQLCHVVIQGEQPREGYFLLTNLIEDQIGGSNGYVDWMLQIYRQVQQSA